MKWLFFLLCFALVPNIQGQQPSYFNFADQEFEGIDIYSIIQDHQYNYWFATDQGIFKHDGYSYEKIECDAMFGTSVFSFVINSKGTIFCSNLNHQIFKIENGKCTLFYTIPDHGSDISLVINKQDELIICSSLNLYVFNSQNRLKTRTHLNSIRLLGPPFLTEDNTIITHTTFDSILVYDAGTFHMELLPNINQSEINSDELLQFVPLKNAVIAISSSTQKVFQFDPKKRTLTSIASVGSLQKNGGVRIYPLGDEIWFASNISGAAQVRSLPIEKEIDLSLYTDFLISYVYRDREGNILLGTFDQGVLVIPDAHTNDVEKALLPYSIVHLVADENDKVYFGTRSGQIIQYDGNYRMLASTDKKIIEKIQPWPHTPYLVASMHRVTIIDKTTAELYVESNGSLKDIAFYSDSTVFFGLNYALEKYTFEAKSKSLQLNRTYLKGRIYHLEKDPTCNALYIASAEGFKYLNTEDKIASITYNKQEINVLDITQWEKSVLVSTRKFGVLVFKKGKIVGRILPKFNNEKLILNKLIVKDNRIYANTLRHFVILDMKGNVLHVLNKSSGLSTNKIIDFWVLVLLNNRRIQE